MSSVTQHVESFHYDNDNILTDLCTNMVLITCISVLVFKVVDSISRSEQVHIMHLIFSAMLTDNNQQHCGLNK